jgi:RNA polymerase sigma factor (sigma-70 family)
MAMKIKQMSDAELVSLYQQGNQQAFAVLLNRYKSKVYSTVYMIVRDRYTAEDITQDVFVKVVDKLRSGAYVESGKFAPWIMRMAHNAAIDIFRKHKRNPHIRMEDGSSVFNSLSFSTSNAESVQIKTEMHQKLRDHIKNLPQTQKEVLLMRHFAQMSFQEIADFTGVSINTALGRMRYALINLRKQLENEIAYDQNLYPS